MFPMQHHPVRGKHTMPAIRSVRFAILAMAVAASLTTPLYAQTSTPTSEGTPTIKVTGPLALKDVFEAITAATAKPNPGITLDFQRMDLPSGATNAVLSGRDIVLVFGRINNQALSDAGGDELKTQWNRLKPDEQVLAARGVAIIVHPRNPIESLTIEQLQSLYSGKVANWKVLGGEDKPIHRYGTPFADPSSKFFHEKVLSAAKCPTVLRKKDSDSLVETLSSDPQGIGFVEINVAQTQCQIVKTLGITVGEKTVSANAQTIKDGTYALAETLTLYTSAKTSDAGKDLSAFLMAGKADTILRQYGFSPVLRAVPEQTAKSFDRIYGEEIKRVLASSDPEQRLMLAQQLLNTAKTTKLDVDTLALMLDTVYTLSSKALGDATTAFAASQLLYEKLPAKRFDAACKRAALYEQSYLANGRTGPEAHHAMETLMVAANEGVTAHQFEPSLDLWHKALAIAEASRSEQAKNLRDRLPAYAARVRSLEEVRDLETKMSSKAEAQKDRARIIWLKVVELDAPADAVKYLDASSEESFRTYLPLVNMDAKALKEDSALQLADWYTSLNDKAGEGGKELMAKRAKFYYTLFYSLHKDRTDALALRAQLGLNRVGGTVPPAPTPKKTPVAEESTGPWLIRQNISPDEPLTDLRLAEYIAANPKLTKLTSKELPNTALLKDLRSLFHLPGLSVLELADASGLSDITALGKLTGLTKLTLAGIRTKNLGPLSTLTHLATLDLSGSGEVSDISPLRSLTALKGLTLTGCPKISELKPLVDLRELTTLDCAGCIGVTDVTPLKSLSKLTALNLADCTELVDIAPLAQCAKLRQLDLRRCEKVRADDLQWLQKHLLDCKILSGD